MLTLLLALSLAQSFDSGLPALAQGKPPAGPRLEKYAGE